MNTFIGKFYFFTKLATSFILLIFVLFLSYLLLRSYQDSNNKKVDITNLVDPLKIEIEKNEKNSQNASNKLASKINALESKTKNIEKILKENNPNSNKISLLNDNIIQLTDRINDLEKSIFDQDERSITKTNSNFKEKDILKKIIIIKFENNLDYKEELVLLESLSAKSKKPVF